MAKGNSTHSRVDVRVKGVKGVKGGDGRAGVYAEWGEVILVQRTLPHSRVDVRVKGVKGGDGRAGVYAVLAVTISIMVSLRNSCRAG